MKIALNKQLDTGQLLDLENHVLEVAEEAYMTEEPRPDLDRFAVDGTLVVQSEELGNAIIDFLSNNVKRIIIWKDDKKVVDKFGNSPLDLEAESVTPAQVVNKLLEDEDLQPWKNPKNWMDKFAAARFVDQAVLDGIPNDAKICVVHGGEIADAILYNDFRGGIHVLIDDGEVSRWRGFKDEETAYGEFLRHDVHAS